MFKFKYVWNSARLVLQNSINMQEKTKQQVVVRFMLLLLTVFAIVMQIVQNIKS